jgi:DNA anti-recombination protein RmuC
MPNMTTKITVIESEVQALKHQVSLLANLLEGCGVQTWLSPEQAAAFLGVSRDSIVREIRRAEDFRQSGKNPILHLVPITVKNVRMLKCLAGR